MRDFKDITDQATMKDAAEIEIYDHEGNKIRFGTLFDEQKTIVVFIRHFFCGSCQLYVENLAAVPQEALDLAGTRIVVIGCGEYNPIKSYKETTKFSGQFYADPTRKLYHTLGMDIESFDKTPADQQKRSYLTLGSFSNLMMSLWRGPFKHPSQVGKQGNHAQLGGDFVFGPGKAISVCLGLSDSDDGRSGNVCLFASRMRHTEDHIEVADLMKEAGVVYQPS